MVFREVLERILAGRELNSDQAESLMRLFVSGEATDAQVGGALAGLAAKGCTGAELASFARVLREEARTVPGAVEGLVDTCGTGGGFPSFNLSTAAAIVASAAGAKVAKHGNRGVTSSCGSADVIEALGARVEAEPEKVLHLLETVGLAFLFAPSYHPALKNVGKVRRELGVRTVFNQLGPLANPAHATRQLIGVYDAAFLRPMGEALLLLGAERALVVHGEDGLDEISPTGVTRFVKIWDGSLEEGAFSPADFGLSTVSLDAVAQGGSVEENAAILRTAVSDPDSDRCAAILPGAAAALWVSGLASGPREGADQARRAVRSGAAARKLEQFIEASQAP